MQAASVGAGAGNGIATNRTPLLRDGHLKAAAAASFTSPSQASSFSWRPHLALATAAVFPSHDSATAGILSIFEPSTSSIEHNRRWHDEDVRPAAVPTDNDIPSTSGRTENGTARSLDSGIHRRDRAGRSRSSSGCGGSPTLVKSPLPSNPRCSPSAVLAVGGSSGAVVTAAEGVFEIFHAKGHSSRMQEGQGGAERWWLGHPFTSNVADLASSEADVEDAALQPDAADTDPQVLAAAFTEEQDDLEEQGQHSEMRPVAWLSGHPTSISNAILPWELEEASAMPVVAAPAGQTESVQPCGAAGKARSPTSRPVVFPAIPVTVKVQPAAPPLIGPPRWCPPPVSLTSAVPSALPLPCKMLPEVGGAVHSVRWLTMQLSCACEIEALDRTLRLYWPHLDKIHVSAALVRLAKLHASTAPKQVVADLHADAAIPVQIASGPSEGIRESGQGSQAGLGAASACAGPHRVSKPCAAHRSGSPSSPVWQAADSQDAGSTAELVAQLLEKAMALHLSLGHRQAANMLWALGSLRSHGMAQHPVCPVLLSTLAQHWEECTPQAISNSVWGMARLGLRPPSKEWLQSFLKQSCKLLPVSRPQELSNLLWSLATLRIRPPPTWMAVYFASSASKLPGFTQQGLSSTLWACAVLHTPPPRPFVSALWPAAAAQLPKFTPEALASTVWALGSLQLRPAHVWTTQLLAAAEVQLPAMPLRALASILWGLARLQSRPPNTWAAAALAASEQRLTTCDLRELTSLLHGLRRHEVRPSCRWLSSAGSVVAAALPKLQAGQAATLLQALAGAAVYSAQAAAAAGQPLQDLDIGRLLEVATPAELSSMLDALCLLGAPPKGELGAACIQQLQKFKLQLSTAQIAQVLAALAAGFHKPPAPLMRAVLGRSLAVAADSSSCNQLVSVLKASQDIGYCPPRAWSRALTYHLRPVLRLLSLSSMASLLCGLQGVGALPSAAFTAQITQLAAQRLRTASRPELLSLLGAVLAVRSEQRLRWQQQAALPPAEVAAAVHSRQRLQRHQKGLQVQLVGMHIHPARRARLMRHARMGATLRLTYPTASSAPRGMRGQRILHTRNRVSSRSARHTDSDVGVATALIPEVDPMVVFFTATVPALRLVPIQVLLTLTGVLAELGVAPPLHWLAVVEEASIARLHLSCVPASSLVTLAVNLVLRWSYLPSGAWMQKWYNASVPCLCRLEPQQLLRCVAIARTAVAAIGAPALPSSAWLAATSAALAASVGPVAVRRTDGTPSLARLDVSCAITATAELQRMCQAGDLQQRSHVVSRRCCLRAYMMRHKNCDGKHGVLLPMYGVIDIRRHSIRRLMPVQPPQ